MSLLPFISQYIVPALLSLYVSVSTFFPIHPIHSPTNNSQKTVFVTQKNQKTNPTQHAQEESHQKSIARVENNTQSNDAKDTRTPAVSEESQQEITPSVKPQDKDDSSVAPTTSSITPVSSITMNAKTTLHMNGKTINLTMSYPSNGGALSGKMSGDCTGTLSGTYEGPSSQKFDGTGNATCPMGPLSIPVTISFTGQLLFPSEASIGYTISAMGQTQKGTTSLTISQ